MLKLVLWLKLVPKSMYINVCLLDTALPGAVAPKLSYGSLAQLYKQYSQIRPAASLPVRTPQEHRRNKLTWPWLTWHWSYSQDWIQTKWLVGNSRVALASELLHSMMLIVSFVLTKPKLVGLPLASRQIMTNLWSFQLFLFRGLPSCAKSITVRISACHLQLPSQARLEV